MYHSIRSKEGFTLVEIMIVVVIIGLLAAMAVPLWQKIRQRSLESRMDNDGRQIASAAHQYFMENNVTSVASGVAAGGDGMVTSVLSSWCKKVGAGYSFFSPQIADGVDFRIEHPLVPVPRFYTSEGQSRNP